MTNKKWFSTKLRFVIMVEPNGADTLNDRIFLLRAIDFEEAFQRAIAIGKLAESEYYNSESDRVIWHFMEVSSLDVISSEHLDGVEIYSEPIHLEQIPLRRNRLSG
jgi:hypothetical protein